MFKYFWFFKKRVTTYHFYIRFRAKKNKLPEPLNPENAGIFIREVKAHRDAIVCMNKIKF